MPGPCATEAGYCVVSDQRLRGLALSLRPLGNIAQRRNQRCCTRCSAKASVMAVGVEQRVSLVTGTQAYPSECADTLPWQRIAIPTDALSCGVRQQPDCHAEGVHSTPWRTGACGTVLGHSAKLSRQRRTRSSPTGSHSFAKCATWSTAAGFELTPLRTNGCQHRLQPCRPRRVGNVAGRATQRACGSHFAVGLAATVDFEPMPCKISDLARCRRLFGQAVRPAIASAAFGKNTGGSRADADRRSCGLALGATTSHRSAELPWAQGAAF